MTDRWFLLIPVLAALSACDRLDDNAVKVAKSDRMAVKRPAVAHGQSSQEAPAEEEGGGSGPGDESLSNQLYQVSDEQLGPLLESIRSEPDPESKQELLTTFYEETALRPAFVRLPLLLELALQPEIEPSLRATIMAELGTTLATDHAASWADWALAIDEHLAANEGLLRVD